MEMIESADGTIKIISLDPTKSHLIIADHNSGIRFPVRKDLDGMIIIKRAGSEIQIVENVEKAEVVPCPS